MARILVVANQTCESPELLEALKARAAQGDAEFYLVVPASGHNVLEKATDPDAAAAESVQHLDRAVKKFKEEGLNVEGQLGDGDPFAADPDAAAAHTTPHMEAAVERMRAEGLNVEAHLGDSDPLAAVQDAVNFGKFDEVIVSTLAQNFSKWLKMDLPTRVERTTGLPVTHIETKAHD
jgi:GABA permease